MRFFKSDFWRQRLRRVGFGVIAAGMGGLMLTLPVTASDAPEEEPEFGVLHVARGVETTYYACAGCHSEMIVAQQGLSRAGWEELLEWMVDEQGMAALEEPELSEVLDYLSAHYNEDRPNFPKR